MTLFSLIFLACVVYLSTHLFKCTDYLLLDNLHTCSTDIRPHIMVSKPSSQSPNPISPTLSDMEFEIDIELGSHSSPDSRSPPIMPSPGEGPLVPHPPMIDPRQPITPPDGGDTVMSSLRKRNVGKISEGAEIAHIETVDVGRRKIADDGLSSPYRTLSKREVYEKTVMRVRRHSIFLAAHQD